MASTTMAGLGHRGTRAVQRMVQFAPSTGGLALWMQHRDLPEGPPQSARPGRAATASGLLGVAGARAASTEPPPVATDGETLLYAPSFETRPEAEQVGLVAHAVLHVALRHAQRYLELQQLLGDVDLALFNVCADAIVNSALGHLSWLQLPARSVTLESLLAEALGVRQPVEKSLLEWDVEQLYRAIDDRGATRAEAKHASRAGGGNSGEAGPAGERAPDEPPRADGPSAAAARALGATSARDLQPRADTAAVPELEAERAREWAERLVRAHAGDGEFSMLRVLLADLPRSRTPWEQVLRTLLARALAPKPTLSWSRPSRSWIATQGRAGPHRRMPWEPGTAATKAAPRLALMVDVSGSVDENLLARFAREVEAITRRLEAGLVLVVGDDRVRRVEHIGPLSFTAFHEPAGRGAKSPGRRRLDLGALAFQGGGGTDFTPLLEEADRHRPDIGIVLTDLEGPARWRPRWPVVWAVPEHCTVPEAPFGRRLALR